MFNKEFYERVILSRFIQERFKANGGAVALFDTFQFMMDKGDSATIDYVWMNIAGSYITWDDHLEDICFQVLDIIMPQPRYSPFDVSNETLASDKTYNSWYQSEWIPYTKTLITKYKYLWEPRYKSKITRGMFDIVTDLETYSTSPAKSNSIPSIATLSTF